MPQNQPLHVIVEYAKDPDSQIKALKDLTPWVAAIIAGLAFLWSIWVRVVDLRWKRSETVRTLFTDAKEDADFRNAISMLDVSGFDLTAIDGTTVIASVDHQEILPALNKLAYEYEESDPNWKRDLRIRQGFDGLFEFMTELEYGLRAKLFPFALIKDRSDYWIKCILRLDSKSAEAVKSYCESADFPLALAFMNRFATFKQAWVRKNNVLR